MFVNDIPTREQAETEIGEIAAEQSHYLTKGIFRARDMILACRRILWLWATSGRDPSDDEVIGVLGIESQCDHVMLREGERKPSFPEYDDEDAEIERLGTVFKESFAQEMRELEQRFATRL